MTDFSAIHQQNISAITKVILEEDSFVDFRAQPFQVTYFKKGGGNFLYIIQNEIHTYLARVNFYPLKNVWRIKEHEFKCLQMLESLQIAPRVYFLDATNKYLAQHFIIVDFVEGEVIDEINDETVISLATVLKKLHTSFGFDTSGSTLPPDDELPYSFDIFSEFADGEDKQIEKYSERAGIENIIEVFNRVKQKLSLWSQLQSVYFKDCKKFTLCHADLKSENMLMTKQGVCLIDWECAGSDVPETDIGRLFSGCQFTAEQEELFLREYFLGDVSEVSRKRIHAVKTILNFFRILEDYILLGRKQWNALAMKEELENFEKVLLGN